MDIEKYIYENFSDALEIVKNSSRATILPHLSLAEKTIIYKYTDDDFTYLDVNRHLRQNKGINPSEFAQHLDMALSKIENFRGLVYRSTDLPDDVFGAYKTALKQRTFFIEYGFLSSSKSELVAKESYTDNYLFEIYGKNGKPIEKIAKFGLNSFDNEFEILFRKNTKFRVLAIDEFKRYTQITIKEI